VCYFHLPIGREHDPVVGQHVEAQVLRRRRVGGAAARRAGGRCAAVREEWRAPPQHEAQAHRAAAAQHRPDGTDVPRGSALTHR
jgi:hypothetical protein